MSLCSPPQNRGSLRNGGCASAQTLDLGGQQTGRTGPQTRDPHPRAETAEQLAQQDWVAGRPRIDERFREARICNSAKAPMYYCTSVAGSVAYLDERCVESGGGRGSSGQVENITGRTGGERARENEFGGPTRRPRRPNQPAGSFRPATRPSYMLSYLRANKKAHVLPLACAACLLGRSPARPHHQAGHLGRFLCHPPPRRTCALR